MKDSEESIEIFGDYVQSVLTKKLAAIQERITSIDNPKSAEQVVKILREANSLISFVCAGDDDLYQEWKYRLFEDEKGKLLIFQGKEINVEYRKRGRSEK